MVSKIKKQETEEEKFIRLFNLGFEQVVAPAMESMEEELKLEMKGLKKEIGWLKEEMGGLKEETEGLKEVTEGLKEEMGGLKKEMGGLKETTEGLKKEMGGLKKEMKQGFKKLNAKIDSHDRRTDNLATQVGDHEKRIKKLESKRVITA